VTKLGILGTFKLLIRALGIYASHQAAIANELRILNAHIARIYPIEKPTHVPTVVDEPMLGDDPYTLAMAADAEMTLRQELGREPSVEEILARMKVWQNRRDPMQGRRDLVDAG
jgi:hypothetical protein